MQEQFPGYYPLSKEEVDELWEKATIAVDANVLLSLYRYPAQTAEDLLTALESLKDRLWLPHHAALEFQRNRIKVIAEQVSRFSKVRSIVEGVTKTAKDSLDALQLQKRHRTIDPERIVSALERETTAFLETLNQQLSEHIQVDGDDPIRLRVDAIFGERVGSPFESQEELNKIFEEGEARYSRRMPPGYADQAKEASKSSAFEYQGLVYQRTYGDLLIWKQLLHHMKETGAAHLIFVTDDQKEDWWWTVDSRGSKKLGPRPELVAELREESEVRSFRLYTFTSFLRQAKSLLNLQISGDSITQAEEFQEAEAAQWTSLHATIPIVNMINPPPGNVTSSNTKLTFTIQGNAFAANGVSSVVVSLRGDTPDAPGVPGPLIPVGTGPGTVVENRIDVTAEQSGFNVPVVINKNVAAGVQNVCFSIEAVGTGPNPSSATESAWTAITWVA